MSYLPTDGINSLLHQNHPFVTQHLSQIDPIFFHLDHLILRCIHNVLSSTSLLEQYNTRYIAKNQFLFNLLLNYKGIIDNIDNSTNNHDFSKNLNNNSNQLIYPIYNKSILYIDYTDFESTTVTL
eukprot:UN07949